MNPNTQYANITQHTDKTYAYKPAERSKSPLNPQILPRDDRPRVSPLKYPMYVPNLQPQYKPIPPQQQTAVKQNTSMIEKENIKATTENKGNVTVDQGTVAESKINAIDRVIQNCNILNLSSPTKQNHQNVNHIQQTNQKRSSIPIQNQNYQTVQNYQTFHQQQYPQPQHQSQTHSQTHSPAHSPAQSQIHYAPHPNAPQAHPQAPIQNPILQHPYVTPPQQHNTPQILCFNKDGKKAKYARFDNPQQAFCSKCSIVLVGMGVKMIDVETPSNTRQRQLKHFIAQVNNLKNTVAKQINSIQNQKSRISHHSREQKEQLNRRYMEIINIYKQFQTKDIILLDEFEQESIRRLTDFEHEFRRSWDKLDLMVKDISPNIDMIKLHITEDQFKGFMQDYNSQIKSVVGRLDTFNVCCKDTKPYYIKREGLDRFNYEGCGQLLKEEKANLYFSFEKTSNEQKEREEELVGQEYPRIQIKSEESWKREQEPFRVLFNQQESKDQIPSPTFKRI